MAEMKEAQRVVTLDDIKYSETSKVSAMISCIPLIGLVMFLVEKTDLFIRYHAAQYSILFVVGVALSIISMVPILGWIFAIFAGPVYSLLVLVAIVYGFITLSGGKRVDLPLVSDWAIKLMNRM